MSTLRRRFPRSFWFFVFPFFLLTACSPALLTPSTTSTDPQPAIGYVLVTANPQATATPFQPVLATATLAPSLTPLPTLTATASATPPPSATPVTPPTALPSATPVPPPAPVAGDKPQYAISALFDYAGHVVTVSEVVLYPNRAGVALPSIVLGVNPNLWNGVFFLQALSVNDQPSDQYTLNGQWLTVNLAPPLEPGQAVKLGLSYRLTLPYSSSKYENFGYTSHQTNLIDWYPFVVPYRNGEWVLRDPYPFGENLVYEEADFRVGLSFADPANAPVVAASAPASLEDGVLVYNLPNARNFTLSASSEYLLSSADANGVTIYNYYYPEDANAAAMVLELTRLAVITYSNEFGSYPHSALTVCETDLNDGLETDGLYFLARSFYRTYDGTVRNNLSVIAVHETAHQWWYGGVASDQALEPWLDEALATYSEHVFYENYDASLLNWWWNFRIYSKSPSGYVDSRLYNNDNFRGYVNAVYFRGAEFLQDLRDRIGDEAFYTFLRTYYANYRGQIVTANDFFSLLSQQTSADYSDLVKTYFYYR